MKIENFSEALHTALRKEIDSRYSVIVYHAIHLLDNDVWGAFCTYMQDGLQSKPFQFDEFSKLLKKWHSEAFIQSVWATNQEKWQQLQKTNQANIIHLFDAAMNCMPDEDIQRLVEALNWMLNR